MRRQYHMAELALNDKIPLNHQIMMQTVTLCINYSIISFPNSVIERLSFALAPALKNLKHV